MSGVFIQSGAESVYNDVVKETLSVNCLQFLPDHNEGNLRVCLCGANHFIQKHIITGAVQQYFGQETLNCWTETILALHLGNTTCKLSRQLLSCLF